MKMHETRRSGLYVALLAVCTAWMSGCGASWEQSRVPFYMYGSPLVSGSEDTADHRSGPEESGESQRYALDDSGEAREVTTEGSEPSAQPASTGESPADSEGSNEERPADSLARAGDAGPMTQEPEGKADLTYVTESMRVNRVKLPEGATKSFAGLYKHCRDEGEVFQTGNPAPGDLVFFHNTADANGDGRNNDWYTHGAVVLEVKGESVRVLGYRGGEVREFRLNRSAAGEHREAGGDVVNTQLRPVRQSDPPYTQYLAGELFAGYCSLLGDRSDAVIMENWRPGMKVTPPGK